MNNNKRLSARGAEEKQQKSSSRNRRRRRSNGEVEAKLNVIDFRARQMQHIRNYVYKEEEARRITHLALPRRK